MTARLVAFGVALVLALVTWFWVLPGPGRFGPRGERFTRWQERAVRAADALLEQDDRLAALSAFRGLLSRHEDSVYLRLQLARTHERLGQHGDALDRIDEALRIAPDDTALALARISALRAAGRTGEAIAAAVSLAGRVERDGPTEARAEVLATAGDLLAAEGRPSEALPLLRRAIALDDGLFPAWRGLGVALSDSGDGAAARTALSRALELAPCDAAALRAEIRNELVVLRDEEAALAALDRAIACPVRERVSEKADLFYERASLRLSRGEMDQALFSLSSALEAGYDRSEWSAPDSPFVRALGDRVEMRHLMEAYPTDAAETAARSR